MSESDQAARRQQQQNPCTLSAIERIHLPQRLRDDAWWLCPTPERPSARVLRFAQRPTPARSTRAPRHD